MNKFFNLEDKYWRRLDKEEDQMMFLLVTSNLLGKQEAIFEGKTIEQTYFDFISADTEEDLPFFLRIILRRIAVICPELKFSSHVLTFVAFLSKNASQAVLWFEALRTATETLGKEIDLGMFHDTLSYKVPTQEGYDFLWDELKKQQQEKKEYSRND